MLKSLLYLTVMLGQSVPCMNADICMTVQLEKQTKNFSIEIDK